MIKMYDVAKWHRLLNTKQDATVTFWFGEVVMTPIQKVIIVMLNKDEVETSPKST